MSDTCGNCGRDLSGFDCCEDSAVERLASTAPTVCARCGEPASGVACGLPVIPAPLATTGPADEAGGLARLLSRLWIRHGGAFRVAAREFLASDWLAARDADQQRIGAEKAWDEGHRSGWQDCDLALNNGTTDETPNPYRADRIAREGQA